jgi:polyferredoxin
MKYFKNILLIIITITLLIISSVLSNILLDKIKINNLKMKNFIITEDMKIKDIIKKNNIPSDHIYEALDINQRYRDFTLKELSIQSNDVKEKMEEQYRISITYKMVMLLKFVLLTIYLVIIFFIIKKTKLSRTIKLLLYGIPIIIFGLLLGHKITPLQPIYGILNNLLIFNVFLRPEVIGFIYFSFLVIIVNKFICSWGCHLGVLQDFIFRTFRDKNDRMGIIKQIKIPFWFTNSIRILFFLTFLIFAFFMSYDIIDPINPFKLFNVLKLGIISALFVLFILILSIFTYRPFCHFICPFGLIGWILEKISIFKIRVDYTKCDDCRLCEKACPTNVMSAILNQDKIVIPDCYVCNTCIDSCPKKAISLSIGKRMKRKDINNNFK